MSAAPRLLIDHCAWVHGQTVRGVMVNHTGRWGDRVVTWPVLQLQGKSRNPEEHELREDIRALGPIAAAAGEDHLAVFTSAELIAERLKSRRPWAGMRGDLWSGVQFDHVPPPLERSTWMGSLTLEPVAAKDHREAFYRLLIEFATKSVPAELLGQLNLTEFQRRNVSRLDEYATLCTAVGASRRGDAFHLWTAICNDIDYFVTTDRKFLRELRKHHPDGELAASRAVCPAELVEALGLPERELPIAEGALQFL